MALADSLLSAIVRADGDALVMHVGERPYVVVGTQTINISTHGLNLEAMIGMLTQLLPAESQVQLEEFGAVEHRIPQPGDDRFTVVAARGGDDIWIEIRRRRAQPAAAVAVEVPALQPAPPVVEAVAQVEPPAAHVEPAPSVVTNAQLEPVVITPAETAPLESIPEPMVQLEPVVMPVAEAEPPLETVTVEVAEPEPQVETAIVQVTEPSPDLEIVGIQGADADVTEPAPKDHLFRELGAVAAALPPPTTETIVEPEILPDISAAVPEPEPETIQVASPEYEQPVAAEAPPPLAPGAEPPAELSERDPLPIAASIEEPMPAAAAVEEVEPIPTATSIEAAEPLPIAAAIEEPAPMPAAASIAASTEEPAPMPIAASIEEAEPMPIAASIEAPEPMPAATSIEAAEPMPIATSIEEPAPMPAAASIAASIEEPAAMPIAASIEEAEPMPIAASIEAPEPMPAATAVEAAEPLPIATSIEEPAPMPAAASIEELEPMTAGVVLPLTRTVRIEVPPRTSTRAASGIDRLLRIAAARGASALFLTSDSRPWIRIEGELRHLDSEPSLSRADVEGAILEIAPEGGHESIRKGEPTEWIAEFGEVGRIRCTTFSDHRGPGVLLRMIAVRAATAEQLGLAREVQALATEPQGLVLVAGPRSGGKSTLISALVDLVNRQRAEFVITLERQIRLVHDNKAALVSQREIRGGADDSVAAARAALRENPDVLVVDDLVSPQMVPLLLTAASEGLLVFVSITAPSTADAVQRFVELAPPEMREAVHAAMAESFRGAVAQMLLKKAGGGLIAAREVLLATAPITRVIGEGQLGQLPLTLESGRKHGMVSFTDALVDYVRGGTVDLREAFRKAPDRTRLLDALRREKIDTSVVERLA